MLAGALAIATAWVIGTCAGDGAGEQPGRSGLGAAPVSGNLLTYHQVSVTFERATAGSAVADAGPADRGRNVAPAL